jgi:predicted DNA-binding transcriptional regulator YafY
MKEPEYGTKVRLMRIFRALLDRPYGYTRQELAHRYSVSIDTIALDFEAFESAGLVVDRDERHRYAFKLEKPLRQLKDLLHFSEEDQAMLYQAIDSLPASTERQQQLKNKLSSLYDYRRLGYSYLRKPHLTKVDQLLQAQTEKRRVRLLGYRSSNSNTIGDRLVEAFHISPPDDTLQTFDVDKKILRHFRISRITRVQLTDEPWAYQGHHNIMLTDPFRIVNNDQKMVYLRLSVSAYNELIERYPLTKSYIEETEDPNRFDFQCMVNANFYGLSNFILGFHAQHVEVLEPEALKAYLRAAVAEMRF